LIAAKIHCQLWLVWKMLANIAVGHCTNTNILETIQTFTAVWKMFSSATTVKRLLKTNIWQQEKHESENENDVDMMQNWQH
jgi:hypothetical protein